MNTRKYWVIVWALFIGNVLNYVDRVNLSIAGPHIAKEFGFAPATMGFIYSSFFYSYILLILPLGMLADKYGSRVVSSAGLLIWSAGALATGAVVGLPSILLARLLLGSGEASTYPTSNRIMREWVPPRTRGLATSLFNIGSTAGPALGIASTSFLIAQTSWRMSFYVLGGFTLIWAILWTVFYRSPESAKWLKDAERKYILDAREVAGVKVVKKMSLRTLLEQRSMWGLVITHGCLTYSIYLFLTWLPSYLMDVRGLTIMSAGLVGTLPYIISSAGTILIGSLSDRYMSNKDVSRGGRKWLVILMLALSSCIFFVPVVESTFLLVAIISASILFATAANTMNLALTGDLIVDKGSAGAAYGLLILGGNTFGFLAPLITGYVIQVTHSYTWSFIIAGLFMVAGIISLSLVNRPLQPADASTFSSEKLAGPA
ncbi:MAG TPA: MFS transporter [Bordetella sp.]